MSRYIDADEFEEVLLDKDRCPDVQDAIFELGKFPTADVIPLDRIKEAREEVAKGWYTRPANRYEEGKKDRSLECMHILDKLIAEIEVEETG